MGIVDKFISGQYRRPSGLVGRYIGGLMVKQHAPENGWTVDLLHAQPEDSILEIGFGGGYAIQQLAHIVQRGKLAGVDFSSTMVAQAKGRNAEAASSGLVDLRYADSSKLPFEEASFNKAFSIHSIYFWGQPLTALREVWRVLKPQGRLILTLLPKATPDEVGTLSFKPYAGWELEEMLKSAGFCETEIKDGRTEAHRSNYSVIGIK
jgi:ubiquinone/menaquinone biosynthesis C-methylase UbiE